MKKLVIFMLLAGLVFCLTAVAEPAPMVGSAAPGLELPDLDGQVVSLPKIGAGKKVILSFFASWSNSCRAELKDLSALQSAAKGRVEVIAVSFDKKMKDLKAFVSNSDFTYPILHDKKLSSIDSFQILIIPTTFCLNGKGVIEKIFVDYDENVKKAIEEWLTRT